MVAVAPDLNGAFTVGWGEPDDLRRWPRLMRRVLAELEREYIMCVLAAEGGNKTRAAQRLGLDRKTLYRKLERYGVRPHRNNGGAQTTNPSS